MDESVLAGIAQAYGMRPDKECPDCESRWDQESEDFCPTCELSLDDLRARLARKGSS